MPPRRRCLSKKKTFSTYYLFYGSAMAAGRRGNCRLSCRKIVAPHLLKLNNTLHPSRRHNRAILNIYVSYTDRCNSFVTITVIGIWNCIHSKLKCSNSYCEWKKSQNYLILTTRIFWRRKIKIRNFQAMCLVGITNLTL